MKYFTNCKTVEELKKLYKKLAFANHPDRGGDTETMKAINNEYSEMFARLKNIHASTQNPGETYTAQESTTETAADFIEILDKLMKCPGLILELCGSWIWISGETYANREALKAAGCKWASGKKCWYWTRDTKKNHHKEWTMDRIKDKFGCETIRTKATARLNPTC